MWKSALCVMAGYVFAIVLSNGDMGPGVWRVITIKKCEEQYHKLKIDIEQKKVNRSHDGFSGKFTLDDDFTDLFGIRIEICKYVDGGCKAYQVMSDNSAINFVNKYAESNRRDVLQNAGVDSADFPIKKGCYEVKNYLFNYDELPVDGVYGEFTALAYLLEGTNQVSCLELQLEFKKVEDHEDCDDHDEEYDD